MVKSLLHSSHLSIVCKCSGVARRRKVGGGAQTFSPKSEKQNKKKKKGHSGVKAQDKVLWIGEGLYSNVLFIKQVGYVQSVLQWYERGGGLGVLPQKIFTELGKNQAIPGISRHVE